MNEAAKTKGVPSQLIFRILLMLNLVNLTNIRQLLLSGYGRELAFGKDAFYQYLKNECIDWRKILYGFSKQFLSIAAKKGDSEDVRSPQCLILDDSLNVKTGKAIEQIGRFLTIAATNTCWA